MIFTRQTYRYAVLDGPSSKPWPNGWQYLEFLGRSGMSAAQNRPKNTEGRQRPLRLAPRA